MKFGFYLLGSKGFRVLKDFVSKFGSDNVSFVVIGQDSHVSNDYYKDIKALCSSLGVKFFKRGEEITLLSDYSYAIGWRWLIKDDDNLIVLHDSLLPKYRGFAPLVNMLINGENMIGVTALFAASEYDKGDVIEQRSILIEYPIKISSAIDIVSTLYSELVLSISHKIILLGYVTGKAQIEEHATYSLWRDESDYIVDWSKSASDIKRFVDAVSTPYSGASTFSQKDKIRILHVEEVEDVSVENRNENIGKCIFMKNNKPVIICGIGLLLLENAYWDVSKKPIFSDISFRTRFISQA